MGPMCIILSNWEPKVPQERDHETEFQMEGMQPGLKTYVKTQLPHKTENTITTWNRLDMGVETVSKPVAR